MFVSTGYYILPWLWHGALLLPVAIRLVYYKTGLSKTQSLFFMVINKIANEHVVQNILVTKGYRLTLFCTITLAHLISLPD